MPNTQGTTASGLHVVDGVLVVKAPDDFDDQAFLALRRGVLATVHAHSVRGVLIDVSGVRMLDSVGFSLLADTARTATLLGARTVFVGFSPGVVSALVDLEVASDDILAVRELADGLDLLRPQPEPEEAKEDTEPADEDGAQDEDSTDQAQEPGEDEADDSDTDGAGTDEESPEVLDGHANL